MAHLSPLTTAGAPATTISMIDLTKRWPLGLNRQNWPDYLNVLLLALFVLLFLDAYVSQNLISIAPVWREPFFFITDFGLSEWVLVPTLVVSVGCAIAWRLVPSGQPRRVTHEIGMVAGFAFLAVGVPGLITNLLKRLFGRGRPAVFDESGAFDFQRIFNDWTYQSFPSGHSTTAIATALVVGFVAPRYFLLVFSIALMTGISRIVVGDHYPTDVLAGFVVGALGAHAVRNLFARRRWLFAGTPGGRVRFRGLPALRRLYIRLHQRRARP